jgi:AcrR family transcriptional regulator
MTDEKRPYRKKARAEGERETRLRITASAVHLHGTVGPSRTSMSAIAEHAGVTRSTLYRHFEDEAAVFVACSAHWLTANPLPPLEDWAAIADPEERLAVALTELYAFYGRVEQMLANLFRDEDLPVVKRPFSGFHGYLAAARDVLLVGRKPDARVAAAIGHAISFHTWRSLVREQSVDGAVAVELATGFVSAARAPRRR